MTLTILGAPRTKKTSNRLVRVRGRHRILPSAANETWTRAAVLQLQAVRARMEDYAWETVEPTTPVKCRALVYRDANRGDLIGYLQAIADALEEARVVQNDRLIVAWDGSRMFVDKANPRVEIELTPA